MDVNPNWYSLQDLVHINLVIDGSTIISTSYKDLINQLTNVLGTRKDSVPYSGKMMLSSEYIMYGKPFEVSFRTG